MRDVAKITTKTARIVVADFDDKNGYLLVVPVIGRYLIVKLPSQKSKADPGRGMTSGIMRKSRMINALQ